MGQQQLLLIMLGVIIVGVSIYLGFNLFRDYAIDAKRNNLINEAVNLASMAQQYYYKPQTMGGGGRTFTNWSIPNSLLTTANGAYSAAVSADSIIISGVGNEVVTANIPVEIQVSIHATYYSTKVIH